MCLDAAVVVSSGAKVGVYRYELHTQDRSDDIRRLQSLGSYRCCGTLALPREPTAGHTIMALAANNSLLSGTLLVASSSRQIFVWDAAAEKVVATSAESMLHKRALTSLRLSQPAGDAQCAQSLDLFYTAGMDGAAKLWDLRTMQVCRTFQGGHEHSRQRLRNCLSPCLRYMCSPSEDGAVCVYDVGSGRVLGGRRAHRDVACSVDLNPRSGAMASGGFDGMVHLHRAAAPDGSGSGRPPGGLVDSADRHNAVREVEMSLS